MAARRPKRHQAPLASKGVRGQAATRAPAVSRREFLEQAALAGTALLAFPACLPKGPKAKDGKAMTGAELAVLSAACDRVFPPDQDPGAVQLGVVDYIDRRLSRPGKRVQQTRHKFRVGLGQLGDWARQNQGKDFVALDGDAQDIALASFAAEGGDSGYGFVRQLVLLTMEGLFADPTYGGNRDKGGWKLIGFDAPCPNPRCE